MADVTYYVALPFLAMPTDRPVAGDAEECQSATTALRRAEILSRCRQYRRDRVQPQRRSHGRRIRRRAS